MRIASTAARGAGPAATCAGACVTPRLRGAFVPATAGAVFFFPPAPLRFVAILVPSSKRSALDPSMMERRREPRRERRRGQLRRRLMLVECRVLLRPVDEQLLQHHRRVLLVPPLEG